MKKLIALLSLLSLATVGLAQAVAQTPAVGASTLTPVQTLAPVPTLGLSLSVSTPTGYPAAFHVITNIVVGQNGNVIVNVRSYKDQATFQTAGATPMKSASYTTPAASVAATFPNGVSLPNAYAWLAATTTFSGAMAVTQ